MSKYQLKSRIWITTKSGTYLGEGRIRLLKQIKEHGLSKNIIKINNKQNIEYICKNTTKYTQQTSNNGFKITKIKKLFNNNWYLIQLINTDMSSFAYYTRFFNYYVFNYYIYCLKSIFKDNYTDEFYKISDTKKTYYCAFFINII